MLGSSRPPDLRPPNSGAVLAFCGIGNPAGFRHTLESCGCEVVELLEFPDHHAYVPADLDRIAAIAKRTNAAAIVCTQKDLVKINTNKLGSFPLWALRVGLEINVGLEPIKTRLELLFQNAKK